LKAKLAKVEVVLDAGPLEIEVLGGVVSGGGGVGVDAGGLYSWWRPNHRRLTR
jgi:hypothetical protein